MIYSTVIEAKNQERIPLFVSGKPMHSKYAPERETMDPPSGGQSAFLIIGGIGAGFHLASLCQKTRHSFIIAVEADSESLAFCRQFPRVHELEQRPDVSFCTVEELGRVIYERYLPSVYGTLSVLFQHAWEHENAGYCETLRHTVQECVRQIAADYSVQAHFGKIWQHNIMCNLARFHGNPLPHTDSTRIAAVVAAGPSLDTSIEELRMHRAAYTVFATDTTYGTLLQAHVIPDIVVSVDAQHVSRTHFFITPDEAYTAQTAPLFVFDICTNASTVGAAIQRGLPVFFVHSGHPLSQRAAQSAPLPRVDAGAGTVTIAVCDIARQLGFARIRLFGADFAYSAGKAYAKGTYLENNFAMAATRLAPAEQAHTGLQFRAPLRTAPNPSRFSGTLTRPFTTDILRRYADTLVDWAQRHGYQMDGGMLLHEAPLQNDIASLLERSSASFDAAAFRRSWLSDIAQSIAAEPPAPNEALLTLLPFVAFLRRQKNMDKQDVFELYKLAYASVNRYNK